MEIKEAQDKVRKFDEERGWKDNWNIKDLALNITEEVGELWGLIKWIRDEEQKKVIKENKGEVANFTADTLFLILKIANQTGVDVEKAFKEVMEEYEKRMPADKMKKVKHANKLAGGHDEKQ